MNMILTFCNQRLNSVTFLNDHFLVIETNVIVTNKQACGNNDARTDNYESRLRSAARICATSAFRLNFNASSIPYYSLSSLAAVALSRQSNESALATNWILQIHALINYGEAHSSSIEWRVRCFCANGTHRYRFLFAARDAILFFCDSRPTHVSLDHICAPARRGTKKNDPRPLRNPSLAPVIFD